MPIPAIFIKQPYAGLIITNRAQMDVKTWSVNYRGKLIIVADHHYSPEFTAMVNDGVNLSLAGLDDEAFSIKGHAIAIVQLVDIVPITIKEIRQKGIKTTLLEGFGTGIGKRYEELEKSGFYLNGWVFEKVRRIEPFPVAVRSKRDDGFGLVKIEL